jgi:hypothetical protein
MLVMLLERMPMTRNSMTNEVFRMATLAGITIKYGVEVNYDLPCLL